MKREILFIGKIWTETKERMDHEVFSRGGSHMDFEESDHPRSGGKRGHIIKHGSVTRAGFYLSRGISTIA